MNRDRGISLAIGAVALLAGLLFANEADNGLRTAVAVVFLLLGPGLAFVRLLRLNDPVTELTLSVAASLGIETVVATALLVTGLWSAGTALAMLILFTLAGVGLRLMA
jgi:hypothetical protein